MGFAMKYGWLQNNDNLKFKKLMVLRHTDHLIFDALRLSQQLFTFFLY